MRKAIIGGYLMDPITELEGYYDILIDGPVIQAVVEQGKLDVRDYDAFIDATGKSVFPGFI
ncbi:MAG: dihydroorotase, partial [Clostridiales bacterium]|nr:dihydroorotase [Clostridiales bacterium]